MKCIVLVDSKYGIARDGKQIYFLKEDLARFKELTLGHTVIMGRKTNEAIGKALPGRTNLVLTHNMRYQPFGYPEVRPVTVAKMWHQFYPSRIKIKRFFDDCFVIGGASIYSLFSKLYDTIYFTKINRDLGADQFFPIDMIPNDYDVIDDGNGITNNGISYSYVTFTKQSFNGISADEYIYEIQRILENEKKGK